MRNHAVWFGRFQPPNIAHVSTLATLLGAWKHVTIGVVHDLMKKEEILPQWKYYLQKLDASSFSPGKNPFSPAEAQAMWQGYIDTQQLQSRVTAKIVPRPEYWPGFNDIFPPDHFDYVEIVGGSGDGTVEELRQRFNRELLGRPVFRITPPFILHNSEIKKRIADGGDSWEAYIPQGAYVIFIALDGPRRMCGIPL